MKKTLDFMFTDDDCYESVESYVTAVDQTKSKLLVNRVKLLRGWKQYDNDDDHEITENFLQGLQTVLRIDPKTVVNNITAILENNKNRLNDLYDSLIIELVPNFIESDDFANYYEGIYIHNYALLSTTMIICICVIEFFIQIRYVNLSDIMLNIIQHMPK